jgi:hypothetical protein
MGSKMLDWIGNVLYYLGMESIFPALNNVSKKGVLK